LSLQKVEDKKGRIQIFAKSGFGAAALKKVADNLDCVHYTNNTQTCAHGVNNLPVPVIRYPAPLEYLYPFAQGRA
jgi:hypothetical protein